MAKDAKWVMVCKRTNDPKLAWIERRCKEMGIPTRRNGESFHAPILEVPEEFESQFDDWLQSPFDGGEKNGRTETIDDIEDDDPTFLED